MFSIFDKISASISFVRVFIDEWILWDSLEWIKFWLFRWITAIFGIIKETIIDFSFSRCDGAVIEMGRGCGGVVVLLNQHLTRRIIWQFSVTLRESVDYVIFSIYQTSAIAIFQAGISTVLNEDGGKTAIKIFINRLLPVLLFATAVELNVFCQQDL